MIEKMEKIAFCITILVIVFGLVALVVDAITLNLEFCLMHSCFVVISANDLLKQLDLQD